MNNAEKEILLNEIEHKVGMIKAFYKASKHDTDTAKELIELYDEYVRDGTSTIGAKVLLQDLNLFLETNKRDGK